MKKILLLLLFVFSITSSAQVFAQDKVYLRTNTCGAFWNSSGNEKAMDAVFGAGKWQYQYFETVDVSALLTKDIHFLFIEGSNCGTNEMIAFLNNNRSAVETWVNDGGNLLINAAPNEGPGTVNLGFGDVRLSMVRSGSIGGVGTSADPDHAMFNGPISPAGSVWSGSALAHRQVLGSGLSAIIKDSKSSEVYLAEKEWGEGSVVIGGMTMAYFQEGLQGWAPIHEVANIHKNLLIYMARGRKSSGVIIETEVEEFADEIINPAVGLEALASNAFCLGAEVILSVTATGAFDATNVFTVQLSDASGDFSSFTAIGELVGANSGEVRVRVPVSTPAGANYRIRVVAGSPAVVSEAYAVVVNPLPAITAPAALTITGTPGVCGAANVQLGTPVTTGGCIAGVVHNAPAVFPLGTTTVTWEVTDISGNKATATQDVTVTGAIPDPAIAVTGGNANTIYLGYGLQLVTLTASNSTSVAGSVAYEWSAAAGLSAAGASAVFAPAAAGAYTLTVTVTNEYGCKASASVVISVVDVRCGNKNNKVLVCHKGQEICISPNAVQAHLDHGCSLGSCSSNETVSASATSKATALKAASVSLVAYPNPFNESATIGFNLKETGSYRLELLDLKGALVKEIAAGEDVAGASLSFPLESIKMLEGIYLIRLVTSGEVKTTKIIYKK